MGEFNRRGIPAGLHWSPDWGAGDGEDRTEVFPSVLTAQGAPGSRTSA